MCMYAYIYTHVYAICSWFESTWYYAWRMSMYAVNGHIISNRAHTFVLASDVQMYVHTYVRVHLYVYICIYVYMYMYICIYMVLYTDFLIHPSIHHTLLDDELLAPGSGSVQSLLWIWSDPAVLRMWLSCWPPTWAVTPWHARRIRPWPEDMADICRYGLCKCHVQSICRWMEVDEIDKMNLIESDESKEHKNTATALSTVDLSAPQLCFLWSMCPLSVLIMGISLECNVVFRILL